MSGRLGAESSSVCQSVRCPSPLRRGVKWSLRQAACGFRGRRRRRRGGCSRVARKCPSATVVFAASAVYVIYCPTRLLFCSHLTANSSNSRLESESNRRARAGATSPPFYYTFCNGCGNRNCFLGHPRAEGLLLLALWFLITAPRGSSPGNKLEVPLRARTKPTLIPTALPREPSGGKKRQVPPTDGRSSRGRRRRKCSSTRNEQDNQSGRGFLYRRHREGGRGTQKGTQKGGRIRRALSPLHFPGASSFWTKTLTVRPAFLTKKAENGRLPFGLSFPLGS